MKPYREPVRVLQLKEVLDPVLFNKKDQVKTVAFSDFRSDLDHFRT